MANEISPETSASLVMNIEEINIKLGELRNKIATLEEELADIKTFCDDMEDFNCFGSFNNLAKSIAENVIKYNDFCIAYYNQHITIIENISAEFTDVDETTSQTIKGG